mmetsp:Transcript_28836/g.94233  ORF Transcript_28836/g.94233 Transcript_28836/m.94233 type:complete len:271 (-) Transcript_28836:701-1513(-)
MSSPECARRTAPALSAGASRRRPIEKQLRRRRRPKTLDCNPRGFEREPFVWVLLRRAHGAASHGRARLGFCGFTRGGGGGGERFCGWWGDWRTWERSAFGPARASADSHGDGAAPDHPRLGFVRHRFGPVGARAWAASARLRRWIGERPRALARGGARACEPQRGALVGDSPRLRSRNSWSVRIGSGVRRRRVAHTLGFGGYSSGAFGRVSRARALSGVAVVARARGKAGGGGARAPHLSGDAARGRRRVGPARAGKPRQRLQHRPGVVA